MQCYKCGTVVHIGDRFCEECGASLTENNLQNTAGGCVKCGAMPDEIDAEGYCSNCGFRNEIKEKNHLEINIQPNLAGVSDRGLRHRKNEDYLCCGKVEEKNAYILVVCDGVSSSNKPELAAKTAAESAYQALINAIENNLKLSSAMTQAIASAQAAVCTIANGIIEDPPSTTIVAAIVQNNTATIGWLGDSRAYWISTQFCQLLTTDDSWFNDMISSGKMTAEEAKKSEYAHAITRWLGADVVDNCEPSIINFEIPSAGYLLLCTDGLWNYAPSPVQIAALMQENSPRDAITISQNLVEYAREKGGADNITVAFLSL